MPSRASTATLSLPSVLSTRNFRMSATINPVVNAEARTITGHQVKQLRREGKLPAVMYGNVKESVNLTLDARVFTKLYREVGRSTLLSLKVGDDKGIKVLVHDISQNPVRNEIMHVDFFAVNLKEKIVTDVPLHFIGVSDAVEVGGGIFLAVKDKVEIECLPDNLPKQIEVDISVLKTTDDSIRIGDLVIPEGVVVLDEADEVVVSISEPISEEELAELDAAPATTEAQTEFDTKSGTEGEPVVEGSEKKK